MSTASHNLGSLEDEINSIEARLDAYDPFRAELDRRAAGRSLADWFRSLPTKARGWGRSVVEFLHLGAIAETGREAAHKAWDLLGRLVAPLRKIGLFNILGALLTCQAGRDVIRSVAGRGARIVTFPFRIVGRVLGWIGRKVGLGRAVDYCERKAFDLEYFVQEKFAMAMDWLDEREHSGAMRWGRSAYQGRVVAQGIQHYAPVNLRTLLYFLSLLIPNIGVGKSEQHVTDNGSTPVQSGTCMESKFSVVKDTFTDVAKTAETVADLANATVAEMTVVPEPTTEPTKEPAKEKGDVEMLTGIIVGSGKKVRLQKVTNTDGTVIFRYNGREYTETTLPGNISLEEKAAGGADAKVMPTNRASRRAATRLATS